MPGGLLLPGVFFGGNMKLSNRLYACAGLVRPGSHAADIGTDHGYLPIYLISNGICESVVAADLRPMPLQAAKNNALDYRTESHFACPTDCAVSHWRALTR